MKEAFSVCLLSSHQIVFYEASGVKILLYSVGIINLSQNERWQHVVHVSMVEDDQWEKGNKQQWPQRLLYPHRKCDNTVKAIVVSLKMERYSTGALVQWLWEETRVLMVVVSNPSTAYQMDILSCKNCKVCLLKRRK